jgi:hypothetical protein
VSSNLSVLVFTHTLALLSRGPKGAFSIANVVLVRSTLEALDAETEEEHAQTEEEDAAAARSAFANTAVASRYEALSC